MIAAFGLAQTGRLISRRYLDRAAKPPERLACEQQNKPGGKGKESASGILVTPSPFSGRRITKLWNPNARPALCRRTANRKGLVRKFSRGIWTCAALYIALGLIGIFFLTSEPGIATSSEGYGIAATASPAPLR